MVIYCKSTVTEERNIIKILIRIWVISFKGIHLKMSLCKLSVNLVGPHDDVIKWKHFQRYWLFVRGIHRSPVNSPHKGQWRGAMKFSLICTWINVWVNNRKAGDLRRNRAHYDITVMSIFLLMLRNSETAILSDAGALPSKQRPPLRYKTMSG